MTVNSDVVLLMLLAKGH